MPVNGAGRLLGRRVLAAAALALACLIALPTAARAETFTVNTTSDEADVVVGNEFCESATGQCSLRAAIEEANAAENEDIVEFAPELFKGDAGSVIDLGAALPTIVHPVVLTTNRCDTEAGERGPCVEVNGVPDAPALAVAGAAGVEVNGLALTGSEAGVAATAAPELKIRGDWIGVGLDGNAAGNESGIEVGPGSDGSRIGAEDPERHNLLANTAGTALLILGSSGVTVAGNEFGVEPSGAQVAPNGAGIVVASTAGEADAVGNVIGTRAGAAGSPVCRLGCNLVSGSESSGIDLSGAGVGDPPIGTTIVGNHIGLDRDGAGNLPNAGVGILVGKAPETVIGGPRGSDANRIVGGSAAVVAGPGAGHLVVQRTLVGSRATEVGSPAPPGEGIVVDSEGLTSLSEEALILDNEIGLQGGRGISQRGPGGTIARNRVLGADVGIWTGGNGTENPIEGNTILASGRKGILVENSYNDLLGNEVVGGGEAGIEILEGLSELAKGNVIGGDSAATENVISGSGRAIAIVSGDESLNEVARNRGAGNSGPFIDLVGTEGAVSGPNKGVQPPAIVVISEVGLAGFAEPGATVRLFRKATPDPGEIASFLGQATADEDGDWSFTFPAPLPAGSAIAATQTREEGTSELKITTVPLPNQGEQRNEGRAFARDGKPPRTRMLKQPRRVRAGAIARFAFTSSEDGSSFQCSLDRGPFKPCRSPRKYRLSQPGRHLFRVRAVDPAGNVDRTPVRRRFEVVE